MRKAAHLFQCVFNWKIMIVATTVIAANILHRQPAEDKSPLQSMFTLNPKTSETKRRFTWTEPTSMKGSSDNPEGHKITQDTEKSDQHPVPRRQDSPHVRANEILDSTLSRMHKNTVKNFANANGFGFGRLGNIQIQQVVAVPWSNPWWSPGELSYNENSFPNEIDLQLIHNEVVRDFSSRKRSAKVGKQPKIDTLQRWEIKAVDLLGLIKHREPVVYVSEQIPEMKKTKNLPIRNLDFFEMAGLDVLDEGKEQFVRQKDGVIRMLGAIRAGKQCINCHSVDKGQLLGAFSYTLRRADTAIRYIQNANPQGQLGGMGALGNLGGGFNLGSIPKQK